MDATLNEIINHVKSIDPYLVLQKVINDHKEILIRLNKEQLDKGIKSTGERLSPYTPKYAKWRRSKGLQTRNPDFKVTDEFRSKIYADVGRMATTMGSKSYKEAPLEIRDGSEIFTLTDENLDRFLYEFGVADDFCDEYVRQIG